MRIKYEDYTDLAIKKYAESEAAIGLRLDAATKALNDRVDALLYMIKENEKAHMDYRKSNETMHNDMELRLMGHLNALKITQSKLVEAASESGNNILQSFDA